MKVRENYDWRMRRFWDHNLCPITGMNTTSAYSRVLGGIKSLKLPSINLNKFRNHKV